MADTGGTRRRGILEPRDIAARILAPARGAPPSLPPEPGRSALASQPLVPPDLVEAWRREDRRYRLPEREHATGTELARQLAALLEERERCVAVLWRLDDERREVYDTAVDEAELIERLALASLASDWAGADYERRRIAQIDAFLATMDPDRLDAVRRGYESPEEQRRRWTVLAVELAEAFVGALRERWRRTRRRDLERDDTIRAVRLGVAVASAGALAAGESSRVAAAALRVVAEPKLASRIAARSGPTRNVALDVVTRIPGLPIKRRALAKLLAAEGKVDPRRQKARRTTRRPSE